EGDPVTGAIPEDHQAPVLVYEVPEPRGHQVRVWLAVIDVEAWWQFPSRSLQPLRLAVRGLTRFASRTFSRTVAGWRSTKHAKNAQPPPGQHRAEHQHRKDHQVARAAAPGVHPDRLEIAHL